MLKGSVKWFNNAKGYGFLISEDVSEDILAHFSVIEMEGFKTLRRGQAVDFELSQGPNGKMATKIVPVIDESNMIQESSMVQESSMTQESTLTQVAA